MSNTTEEGINNVKVTACDLLLNVRVESKISNKKIDEFANRITITYPKARDHKDRPALIPSTVLLQKESEDSMMDQDKMLEKDIERLHGGPGVYNADYRIKHYTLANDDWRTDNIPEIMDGKNVADFVDPDIEARLQELELEEDRLQKEAEENEEEFEGLDEDEENMVKEIKTKKIMMKHEADAKLNRSKVMIPRSRKARTMQDFTDHLDKIGVDSKSVTSRLRSASGVRGEDNMDEDDGEDMIASALGKQKRRVRSVSVAAARAESLARVGKDSEKEDNRGIRSKSRPPTPSVPRGAEGYKTDQAKTEIVKKSNKIQKKTFGQSGRLGESDRFIGTKMPKHLFSGKMGKGTRNSR